MCIVQNEAPRSANARHVVRNDVKDQLQTPLHFLCEVLIMILSGAAFSIALFLLTHGLWQSQACLPLGCIDKAAFPVLYALTLITFAILVALMTYVVVSSVTTICRARVRVTH
jgi:ABC-type antimicrobial peptide transport system permease subunit